jgi:hypothetical protein
MKSVLFSLVWLIRSFPYIPAAYSLRIENFITNKTVSILIWIYLHFHHKRYCMWNVKRNRLSVHCFAFMSLIIPLAEFSIVPPQRNITYICNINKIKRKGISA